MIRPYILLLAILFPLCGLCESYVEGKDYQFVPVAEQVATSAETVHVMEFFSYGCPWCYRLDNALMTWVGHAGKAIYFTRVPVVFNKNWSYYAKASYIIDAFSLGKPTHDALFKAIVLDKQPMNSDQDMIDFFAKHGVEASVVQSALVHSPSIDLRLANDASLMAKYQITAVPTVVVADKYKTNLQMAKSEKRLFDILDYLVKKATKETHITTH